MSSSQRPFKQVHNAALHTEQSMSLLKKSAPASSLCGGKERPAPAGGLHKRQATPANRCHFPVDNMKSQPECSSPSSSSSTSLTSVSNSSVNSSSTRATTATTRLGATHAGPTKKKAQKPRRRVATVAQRRAANIRERRRMFNLNSAFDRLRKKVPSFAYEKRLSRIETLKLAIMYIRFMHNLVNDDAYAEKYKKLTANLAHQSQHPQHAQHPSTCPLSGSLLSSAGGYLSSGGLYAGVGAHCPAAHNMGACTSPALDHQPPSTNTSNKIFNLQQPPFISTTNQSPSLCPPTTAHTMRGDSSHLDPGPHLSSTAVPLHHNSSHYQQQQQQQQQYRSASAKFPLLSNHLSYTASPSTAQYCASPNSSKSLTATSHSSSSLYNEPASPTGSPNNQLACGAHFYQPTDLVLLHSTTNHYQSNNTGLLDQHQPEPAHSIGSPYTDTFTGYYQALPSVRGDARATEHSLHVDELAATSYSLHSLEAR